ncbi:MAG: SIS domain-containing protein [Minisyncoccia bacterium]
MASYEENLTGFKNQLSFKGLSALNLKTLSEVKPNGIVVFGMGGSGIPGIILEKLADEMKIPVPVVAVRDDKLPRLFFKKPLFIAVSFSGETAETLKILNAVLKIKNASVAAITGGGKLKKLAKREKLPSVFFRKGGLTPRESSAKMFYGIVRVLNRVFPIKVLNSPKLANQSQLKNLGKKLARAANNRDVLIYTASEFSHLGQVWETNLDETAKTPAFANVFPELSHNEIAGFKKKSGNWIIFWLKDKSTDDKKIKNIEKILGGEGIKSVEIPLTGGNKQEKTWNSILLSHWTALELAKLNKINPRKTEIIDKLKK